MDNNNKLNEQQLAFKKTLAALREEQEARYLETKKIIIRKTSLNIPLLYNSRRSMLNKDPEFLNQLYNTFASINVIEQVNANLKNLPLSEYMHSLRMLCEENRFRALSNEMYKYIEQIKKAAQNWADIFGDVNYDHHYAAYQNLYAAVSKLNTLFSDINQEMDNSARLTTTERHHSTSACISGTKKMP